MVGLKLDLGLNLAIVSSLTICLDELVDKLFYEDDLLMKVNEWAFEKGFL